MKPKHVHHVGYLAQYVCVHNVLFVQHQIYIRLSCYADGQDFTAGSVDLVFPADATELCTTVPILNDTIAGEGDEEFTVEFTLDPGTSGVQPGRTMSTVTIIDNDGEKESTFV